MEVIALLKIISIAIVAGLLTQVQSNLNQYWASVAKETLVDARIGVGEAIFGLIGILLWINTFALLLSSSYRGWT